jgi:hypothetical protein
MDGGEEELLHRYRNRVAGNPASVDNKWQDWARYDVLRYLDVDLPQAHKSWSQATKQDAGADSADGYRRLDFRKNQRDTVRR